MGKEINRVQNMADTFNIQADVSGYARFSVGGLYMRDLYELTTEERIERAEKEASGEDVAELDYGSELVLDGIVVSAEMNGFVAVFFEGER